MASKRFYDMIRESATSVAELLVEKNEAYGDSINVAPEIMKILYPNGIPPEKLDDSLTIVRILDKLCRIARGDESAFGESPWKDITGYALLQWIKKRLQGKE